MASITPKDALVATPTGEQTHSLVTGLTGEVGGDEGFVQKKFKSAMDNATNFMNQAALFMAHMEDLVDDIDEPSAVVPLAIFPFSYSFDEGELPVSPSVSLDFSGAPGMGNLIPVDLPNFAVDIPIEEITSPTNVLTVAGQLRDLTLVDAVNDKLLDDLINGATGLGAAVETDLWNRNYERDWQAYHDGLDSIADEWSKRGFSLPDGVLANAVTQAGIEFTNKRLDTSRDIAIKQAEMALQNQQFSTSQAIALDAMLTGYMTAVMNLEVQIAGALLSAAQVMASIHSDIAKVQLDYNRNIVSIYASQIAGWSSELDAVLKKADSQMRKYEGQLRGYEASSNTKLGMARVDVAVQEAGIQTTLAQANFLLKQFEVNLSAYQHEANLRMEAARGGAQVAAQIAAGIFAGVNVSAHLQASAGVTETFGRSVGFSEDHNWTEPQP